MPDVENKIAWSRDLDGVYRKTIVRQSFTDFEPAGNAIQYRKEYSDAVYQITEDVIELGGEGTWQIDCTTTQEPIETHIYFATIAETDKRNWALWKKDPKHPQLSPTGWDPSQSGDTAIQTLLYWWNRDVTSYLAPRIVARWTVVEQHPPDTSQVGKIAVGWTLPPINEPEDINFLLAGATGKQLGSPTDGDPWWQNTYELLSSARNNTNGDDLQTGWIKFLYQ
jgi:hypothetical protein